jgi:hypothetical protein
MERDVQSASDALASARVRLPGREVRVEIDDGQSLFMELVSIQQNGHPNWNRGRRRRITATNDHRRRRPAVA